MKILKKAILASGLLFAGQGVQAADRDWDVNFSAYLGHKSLDDNDWPRIDSQVSFGLLFDFKKQQWPVPVGALEERCTEKVWMMRREREETRRAKAKELFFQSTFGSQFGLFFVAKIVALRLEQSFVPPDYCAPFPKK